ncbi:MAG: hypothetical protein J6P60_04125, partial [Lachnospiraceae bacterium]|nr:hypothetical protein [Lachnospiraceae bacterium]
LFVIDTMAEYIMLNLDKVKHTHVRVTRMEEIPEQLSPHLKEREIIAASLRLDVVIAAMCNLSRSKVTELFRERKVFVKGRLNENSSYLLKPEDVVTVRGFGKFIFDSVNYETRKGRLCLTIREYV